MKLGRQLAQMQVSRTCFYPEFPQTRFQDSQYSWILLGSLTKCKSKDSDDITVFVGFNMGLFEHGGTSYPLVTHHCLAEYCHVWKCLGVLRPYVSICFPLPFPGNVWLELGAFASWPWATQLTKRPSPPTTSTRKPCSKHVETLLLSIWVIADIEYPMFCRHVVTNKTLVGKRCVNWYDLHEPPNPSLPEFWGILRVYNSGSIGDFRHLKGGEMQQRFRQTFSSKLAHVPLSEFTYEYLWCIDYHPAWPDSRFLRLPSRCPKNEN